MDLPVPEVQTGQDNILMPSSGPGPTIGLLIDLSDEQTIPLPPKYGPTYANSTCNGEEQSLPVMTSFDDTFSIAKTTDDGLSKNSEDNINQNCDDPHVFRNNTSDEYKTTLPPSTPASSLDDTFGIGLKSPSGSTVANSVYNGEEQSLPELPSCTDSFVVAKPTDNGLIKISEENLDNFDDLQVFLNTRDEQQQQTMTLPSSAPALSSFNDTFGIGLKSPRGSTVVNSIIYNEEEELLPAVPSLDGTFCIDNMNDEQPQTTFPPAAPVLPSLDDTFGIELKSPNQPGSTDVNSIYNGEQQPLPVMSSFDDTFSINAKTTDDGLRKNSEDNNKQNCDDPHVFRNNTSDEHKTTLPPSTPASSLDDTLGIGLKSPSGSTVANSVYNGEEQSLSTLPSCTDSFVVAKPTDNGLIKISEENINHSSNGLDTSISSTSEERTLPPTPSLSSFDDTFGIGLKSPPGTADVNNSIYNGKEQPLPVVPSFNDTFTSDTKAENNGLIQNSEENLDNFDDLQIFLNTRDEQQQQTMTLPSSAPALSSFDDTFGIGLKSPRGSTVVNSIIHREEEHLPAVSSLDGTFCIDRMNDEQPQTTLPPAAPVLPSLDDSFGIGLKSRSQSRSTDANSIYNGEEQPLPVKPSFDDTFCIDAKATDDGLSKNSEDNNNQNCDGPEVFLNNTRDEHKMTLSPSTPALSSHIWHDDTFGVGLKSPEGAIRNGTIKNSEENLDRDESIFLDIDNIDISSFGASMNDVDTSIELLNPSSPMGDEADANSSPANITEISNVPRLNEDNIVDEVVSGKPEIAERKANNEPEEFESCIKFWPPVATLESIRADIEEIFRSPDPNPINPTGRDNPMQLRKSVKNSNVSPSLPDRPRKKRINSTSPLALASPNPHSTVSPQPRASKPKLAANVLSTPSNVRSRSIPPVCLTFEGQQIKTEDVKPTSTNTLSVEPTGISKPKLPVLIFKPRGVLQKPGGLRPMKATISSQAAKDAAIAAAVSPDNMGRHENLGREKFIPPIASSSPIAKHTPGTPGTPSKNKRNSLVKSSGYGRQSVNLSNSFMNTSGIPPPSPVRRHSDCPPSPIVGKQGGVHAPYALNKLPFRRQDPEPFKTKSIAQPSPIRSRQSESKLPAPSQIAVRQSNIQAPRVLGDKCRTFTKSDADPPNFKKGFTVGTGTRSLRLPSSKENRPHLSNIFPSKKV